MTADHTVQAKHGETIVLKIGQQVALQDLDESILFSSIAEDSRCPEGTHCMWAGQARVQLKHKGNTIELKVPGMKEDVDLHKTYDGWVIHISKLAPYPRDGVEIKAGDYQLHLRIQKAKE